MSGTYHVNKISGVIHDGPCEYAGELGMPWYRELDADVLERIIDGDYNRFKEKGGRTDEPLEPRLCDVCCDYLGSVDDLARGMRR